MALALYTHRDMLDHAPHPRNPEQPARLAAVRDALAETDLDLEPHEAPLALRADLERVHDPVYLDALERVTPRGADLVRIDPDTWLSSGSLTAASRAAGAAIQAVRDVAAGQVERAFCAVRPPGHHAGPDFSMGFCIYSTLALAARAAQAAGLARVAVIDFDVHHGNGTQAAFEAAPNQGAGLFFASVHQAPLWPGTGEPHADDPAHIVNAISPPGAPRETWRAAFTRLMTPLDAFAPDLILISAGFDAHARDPLAQQNLEAEDYGWATRAILEVARTRCGGRVVSSLEGGYDLRALAASTAAHVAALHG
ncbi:MAG: histone deacetylase family protein [Alphaproteobacteria bacterium]|nr:histone deacetylase family protein [Alphaproteobacteria bacterium]